MTQPPGPSGGPEQSPQQSSGYPGQPYGSQQPLGDPTYSGQSYGGQQPFGDPAYSGQAYSGQPYGDQSYGGQQPFGDPAYSGQAYGGQPPPDGPPRQKSPLPWIFGGVGGLVAVGGIVLLVLLLTTGGGSGSGSPDELADDVVSALNDLDADALSELTCEGNQGGEQEAIDALDPAKQGLPADARGMQIVFTKDSVEESGDSATANLTATLENVPPQYQDRAGQPRSLSVQMRDDDGWCATNTTTGPPA